MVASFHLIRYGRDAAPAGLSRMGLDRPLLRRVEGLGFWKLLGTGRGGSLTLSADLRRWALFAVWESEGALDAFLDGHEIPARWAELARELYGVRLRPLRSKGTWSGRDPFAGVQAAERHDGPVAILTRATMRPSQAVRFWRSVAGPAHDLAGRDGLLASIGIGEWPLLRQATFSMWSSLAAAQEYAYRRPEHRAVVARTRQVGWYSEELFARFAPFGAAGTWDGREPLATDAAGSDRPGARVTPGRSAPPHAWRRA